MTKIDPFSLTTVPLELCANGNAVGNATGFVWKDREQHYLITNWHVVSGRNARTGDQTAIARPNMVRAMFNTRIMNFGKKTYEISIRDADHKPLWYWHPVRGRGSDVVAIPLPIDGDDPIVNLYPINVLKSEGDLAVRIGMDVYILGYPFGAEPPGFPVWKRGSIASEPDLTRIGTGYILVDTASRPGMSGAPVIRRSWGVHLLEQDATSQTSWPESKFIGIYSGRRHTNDPSDAQLGMVWPVHDIQEVIIGKKLDSDE
ncbi:trypsin-like peptidase domain-containing protein [Bradyrhizobium tropiciagri]|uniref:S1 family peptidase n=1 Tax=Bradyrhizobium tropiciagri TaxID=312253 RepID=UPI001BAC5B1F|nr:serine protease [Bradyrhizobium tropiciagri]MBR0899107.1 trypsin-like peptidase domain-containing protein [Bradyrhizobium tropiciagri]